MRPKYPKFAAGELSARIDEYFIYIKGISRTTRVQVKNAATKTVLKTVWDRLSEPATITGLTLFLGFTSRRHFDEYEQNGKYAETLKRGRLRVEAVYEQKLHDHYTSGPIFALKSMGWTDSKISNVIAQKSLKIKIIESGPKPSGSEREVVIEDEMPSIIQSIP